MTDKETELLDLVTHMVKCLVDVPEEVAIVHRVEGVRFLVDVQIPKPDLGRVIGKCGRTARSIRTVMLGTAQKLGMRFEMNLCEREEELCTTPK